MKPFIILLTLFNILSIPKLYGQFSNIDTARRKVYTAATDKEKLTSLIAIIKYRNSLPGDSLYHYARLIKQLAIKLNDKRSMAFAEYSLLVGDLVKGKTDSIISRIENNGIFENIKKTDKGLYYKLQFAKANALNRLNKRTEALDLQFKILNEAEKEDDINSQLFALNYIGATYLNVENKGNEAKQTWLSALKIIEQKNNPQNKEIEAYILSNLGLYYSNLFYITPSPQLEDTSFYYFNATIRLCKEIEAMSVMASMLSYRANLYAYKKMFVNAEADFKEVVSIRKKIGDPLYVSEDYIALAQFYFSTKEYTKCIEEVNEGLKVCKQGHILATELALLGVAAEVYKTNKVYDKYSATLEKIIMLSDSNNHMNSADKIADIQTKYDVQKKETLITKQKLDLLQRNFLLYGAGALAIVFALFFGYRFKKYQQKQQIIAEQKRKQNEVAIKDAEEKERKRIAAELHDNLGVQANAILHNSTLLKNSNIEDKNIVADLQDTAKEMLLNLRETLWAMKTSDVSATDLWLRIINFMKQMGRHYTAVNFRVEGEVPKDFVISSSKALNIVLVLQESVNNAVKHANANTISAISLKNDDSWIISIKDDGKGFDIYAANGKTDSYGLQNMRERAIAGRFNYNIDSAPGKGTKTIISIAG